MIPMLNPAFQAKRTGRKLKKRLKAGGRSDLERLLLLRLDAMLRGVREGHEQDHACEVRRVPGGILVISCYIIPVIPK